LKQSTGTEEAGGKNVADIDLIKVVKKHGKSLDETELVKGMVLDKEIASSQMPKTRRRRKNRLLNSKMEIEKPSSTQKSTLKARTNAAFP
jgi:chaperonin GroEL (HSP60 family)